MNPLSFKQRFFYGLGCLGENFIFLLISSFLLIFYTDVFLLAPAIIGTMFFISRIIDAISSPFLGIIIDKTNTPYGRFRPYILIGAIGVCITTILCFTTISASYSIKIFYIYITYILWGAAYSIFDIAFWALTPTLTKNPIERTKLCSFSRVLAFIGTLLASALVVPCISLFGQGNAAKGYQWTAILFSLIFLFCSIITFTQTKESNIIPSQPKSYLKEFPKVIFTNRPLLMLLITLLIGGTFAMLRLTIGIYYVKYYFNSDNLITWFNITNALASIIGVMVVSLVANKCSKKASLIGGLLISCFGGILMYFANSHIGLFLFSNCITSMGAGIITVMFNSMVADTVEYAQWKTGLRSEGVIFSTSAFATKCTSALSGAISGIFLGAICFVPNTVQQPSTLLQLKLLMTIIPSIGALIALVPVLFYNLDSKKFSEIIKELK